MRRNIGFGLVFIAIALVMILNAFGYFPDIDMTRLIISLLCIVIMISSLIKFEFFGLFVPASILVMIYKYELALGHISNFYIVLIGIFLAIGFSSIFKRRRVNNYYYQDNKHNNYHRENDNYNTDDEPSYYEDVHSSIDEQDIITYESKFASTTRFVKSNNLERLNINNSFGHMRVYLDKARLNKNGAVININNSCGDLRLYIPKEYRINDNIEVTLGNVSIKSTIQSDVIENTITLNGYVSLGNVEIVLI